MSFWYRLYRYTIGMIFPVPHLEDKEFNLIVKKAGAEYDQQAYRKLRSQEDTPPDSDDPTKEVY